MASQRDAGMMKEGRPKRGNENPVLESVGIDKNLAKAARKAYPEGWPKSPARPKPLTPDELKAKGFSPKTERYYTDDGGTASRIKLQKDERDSLKAENAGLKAEVVRLKADHKAEVARLTADLEAEQTGSLMKMSATAMAKRKELAAKLEDQKEIRKGTETVPDEKTKEAYERTIERLKAKIRVLESKLAAFMANGATVLDKADRKAILVCLHPDGTSDPNERARREIAFKLFSAAVPEREF
jgi:predicted Zn-dependent protease